LASEVLDGSAMMNAARRVAFALPILLAASAHADDTRTESANTLVVVTPNAPIVVQQGQGPSTMGAQAQVDEPPAPPTTNGAPQNEDWNNVSHINGSVIPVGDRNQYLYKFKRYNISTDPFGPLYGNYSFSGSVALSENIVFRGDVSFGKQVDADGDGMELAASLPIYFRRAYSGPFLEPGLVLQTINRDDGYVDNSGSYNTMSTTQNKVAFEMMIGWHWSFDSGLNLALAGGMARVINSDNNTDYYSGPELQPAGYFRVGYEF
jgi:hypothetical protein